MPTIGSRLQRPVQPEPPVTVADPGERREKLKEIFPHEADGLDRYYRFYDTMLDLMTLARRAESAGGSIAREIRSNDELGYNIIGFVDDDPAKRGERLHGIRVLGRIDDLPPLIAKYSISQILIAMPSSTGIPSPSSAMWSSSRSITG